MIWNSIFLTVGNSLPTPPSSSLLLQVPRKPVKGLTDGATYTPVKGELEEEMTCLPKVTYINNILTYYILTYYFKYSIYTKYGY